MPSDEELARRQINWDGDNHVAAALEWLVALMGDDNWSSRRSLVRERLRSMMETKPVAESTMSADEWTSLIGTSQLPDDMIAWYMLLAEMYVEQPWNYEHAQGSRVIPIMHVLGRDLAALRSIPGSDGRMRRMVQSFPDNPDSVLFECLVALAYRRENWEVSFIDEGSTRAPDIAVRNLSGHELQVECKRKFKLSEYARIERASWIRLFAPVREYLRAAKESLVVDVTFHQELASLPDGYLGDLIIPKLRLAVPPARIIDNDELEVEFRRANVERCQKHLEKNRVKMTSSLLNQLLYDFAAPERGITTLGRFKIAHTELMMYADGVDWAAAGIWSCDAPEAIQKKTQSLHRQLLDAADQIGTTRGAIHIGVETYDGELLDLARHLSVIETMSRTSLPPTIEWVYFHQFGFEVPPDENWAVEEKCHYFGVTQDSAALGDRLLLAFEHPN